MHNAGKNNNFIRLWLKWAFPLALIAVIILLKFFPTTIEKSYSSKAYIGISTFLRAFTRLLPVSIGDLFYAMITISLLLQLIRFIRKWIKKQLIRQTVWHGLGKMVRQLLWVYIIFNLFWGLNYNRLGIAWQLHLQPKPYNKEELEKLVCLLIEKTNAERKAIGTDSLLPQPATTAIFTQCIQAYDSIALRFPFLEYHQPAVKGSIFNSLGKYFGFTGYYNPFSGEAQVRTDVPRVLLPYTTCHEIAHQLGYASESEANFVGYLACSAVQDHYFRYSVYMDLYKYAAYELLYLDPNAGHGWELDSLVKQDMQNIRNFFLGQQNRVSPVMNSLYDQYLKANQQESGIESYNEVIGWLLAYYRQYHTL